MKSKIEEALKTEFKELGLGDKTIGRLADYIISKGTVTKEEEIATAVKGDDVKLIAKSIQGEIDGIQKAKKKAEDDLEDYKAKHPAQSDPDPKGEPNKVTPPVGLTKEDVQALINEATAAAVKSVKDEFDAYKALNSAKEMLTVAKNRFFENKWTTKFKDEANDAWERVIELNEAKGGNMTTDELSAKATEYFQKSVKRLGTDVSEPFTEEGKNQEGKFDFSSQAKYLEAEGLIPKEEK